MDDIDHVAAAQEASTQTHPDDRTPPAGHCVLPHGNNPEDQLSHGRNQGGEGGHFVWVLWVTDLQVKTSPQVSPLQRVTGTVISVFHSSWSADS